MTRTAALWSILRDSDGPSAIVVPSADTPTHEALCEAIGQQYGGGFPATHPLIIEAAQAVKVEAWHSCSKSWKENEGALDDPDMDWWSPNGDGRRTIFVVPIEVDLYDLGDACELHDLAAAETSPSDSREVRAPEAGVIGPGYSPSEPQ